eukprot:360799-Chlamydomonas_euryale.AAC.2
MSSSSASTDSSGSGSCDVGDGSPPEGPAEALASFSGRAHGDDLSDGLGVISATSRSLPAVVTAALRTLGAAALILAANAMAASRPAHASSFSHT